ncbi:MAG: hypothetical protein IPJ03_08050 [Ignavibacteriales bacterium]|nr:hypothetical protein [Ignavibacteriales bacterium]
MVRLFGYFCCALFLLITSLSCDSSEPPPTVPPPDIIKDTITVSIEGFTHRSVTFRIQSTVHSPQSSIKVLRSFNSTETIIAEFPLEVADTTITDDDNGIGLMLDTTYTYFAVRIDSLGEETDTSNIVTQKTLAPTSHDYTWQEYTFGDPGYPNTLYDVWGTDENNVWVCGGVKMNDTVYGIIKWDGIEWKPEKKIGGLQAIYGFSETDIWAIGGGVWYYDGGEWISLTEQNEVFNFNGPYTSLWGTSSSDMYLGNTWGKIIHWDGVKAEVVSDISIEPLNDMEGLSSDFIMAVGTDFTPPATTLYFNGTQWSEYPFVNNDYSLNSVTVLNSYEIYWAGEKIVKTTRQEFSESYNPGYYVWDIEYNHQSGEVVASGAFDGVYIYNGLEWKSLQGVVSQDETTYTGIFLINETIFCAGSNDSRAKIIIGKTTK